MLKKGLRLVLASRSPRRKIILQERGYHFVADTSDFDEESIRDQDIRNKVIRTACGKAAKVAGRHHGSLVLGVDTLVYFRKKPIGQVKNGQEALEVLTMLSGKTHRVYSGICLLDTRTGKMFTDYDVSAVKLKKVSPDKLKEYIQSGKFMGKAGAYNISDPDFESFVDQVKGSYYNIMGLPIEKLEKMLGEVA